MRKECSLRISVRKLHSLYNTVKHSLHVIISGLWNQRALVSILVLPPPGWVPLALGTLALAEHTSPGPGRAMYVLCVCAWCVRGCWACPLNTALCHEECRWQLWERWERLGVPMNVLGTVSQKDARWFLCDPWPQTLLWVLPRNLPCLNVHQTV